MWTTEAWGSSALVRQVTPQSTLVSIAFVTIGTNKLSPLRGGAFSSASCASSLLLCHRNQTRQFLLPGTIEKLCNQNSCCSLWKSVDILRSWNNISRWDPVKKKKRKENRNQNPSSSKMNDQSQCNRGISHLLMDKSREITCRRLYLWVLSLLVQSVNRLVRMNSLNVRIYVISFLLYIITIWAAETGLFATFPK